MNTYVVRFEYGAFLIHADNSDDATKKAKDQVMEAINSCEIELWCYGEYGSGDKG